MCTLQLDLITELLGTPKPEDMRGACDGARSHMMRQRIKPASLSALYGLSSQATHEAVHLLCRMLVFDQVGQKFIRTMCDLVTYVRNIMYHSFYLTIRINESVL